MKQLLFAACVLCSAAAWAHLEIVSPAKGAVVDQLWPDIKAFLNLPRAARQQNSFRLSKQEKASFKAHRDAMPVVFTWKGDTNGVYSVKVARVPDGRVWMAAV